MAEITFWPNSTKPSVASYRIRCAQVRSGLRAIGIATGLRDETARGFVRPPRVLILSKRTDPASLALAIQLRRDHGTRLVLDLCDNVYFGFRQSDDAARQKFQALTGSLDQLDLIVTPSDYLRDIVARHVRRDMPFAVIPDAVEAVPAATLLTRLRNLRAFRRLARVREGIEESGIAEGRRLLWFGIGGTRKARNGLHDLAAFAEVLEQHDFRKPISLTVLSNSRKRYEELIAPLGLRTFYAPWNYWTFNAYFEFHDIALLPVRKNDYNWAKSANRLTTAFANRVAVCATAIPSYEPFRRAAVLDDWEDGLAQLMDQPMARERRIEIAAGIIARDYRLDAVVRRWADLISDLMSTEGWTAARTGP